MCSAEATGALSSLIGGHSAQFSSRLSLLCPSVHIFSSLSLSWWGYPFASFFYSSSPKTGWPWRYTFKFQSPLCIQATYSVQQWILCVQLRLIFLGCFSFRPHKTWSPLGSSTPIFFFGGHPALPSLAHGPWGLSNPTPAVETGASLVNQSLPSFDHRDYVRTKWPKQSNSPRTWDFSCNKWEGKTYFFSIVFPEKEGYKPVTGRDILTIKREKLTWNWRHTVKTMCIFLNAVFIPQTMAPCW